MSRSSTQLASPNSLTDAVGANLNYQRSIRGLSMRHLARLAGCSPTAVRRAEAGIGTPDIATICSICAAMGIGWSDLLASPSDHVTGDYVSRLGAGARCWVAHTCRGDSRWYHTQDEAEAWLREVKPNGDA